MKKSLIIVIAIVTCVIGAGAAIQFSADSRAKNEIDALAAEVSDMATVKYGKVKTSFLNRGVTVSELTVTPVGEDFSINIGSVSLDGWDPKYRAQLDLCLNVDKVEVPKKSLTEIIPDIEHPAFGYPETIFGSFNLCYKLSPQNGTLDISDLHVAAEDMGTIGFKTSLGNIKFSSDAKEKSEEEIVEATVEQIQQNPFAAIGMVMQVALNGAELTYSDASFFKRGFQYQAAVSGDTTVEELKKNLKQELLVELNGEDELSRQAREAITNFIDTPGTINVSIAPVSPFPVIALKNFDSAPELLEQLNISVSN